MSAESGSPAIRIDAHHHFWTYSPAEYGWIGDSMAAIRRDFLPEHLDPELRGCGIAGVVSVQARQTLEETQWLLALASQSDFILGVVGWVPLVASDVRDIIGSLVGQGRLKAVRHVLQTEPDDQYMLRDDFNHGIDSLREFGLAYDILIFERHLSQTIRFVDRHPKQIFVLDHIAKPRIRDHVVSAWRENLCSLAERPNVYCKLSGMVTEADYKTWTKKDLAPYFDTVLQAFGPQRLMFGSDWPVCLVAVTYRGWFNLVSEQIAALSDAERDAILGGTAIRVYRLGV
ncbi:MAG: amidohydrolase family protein [Bryobacteraceae bacterium]